MALVVRVKPRAERQIDAAADWWSENRPTAPGAIRSDLKAALEALVEQHGHDEQLAAEALSTAVRYNQSVYDMLYVILAGTAAAI